jgi:superoxide dismutase, Fe-Mn family
MMAPGGAKEPGGALAEGITKSFGGLAQFKEQFAKACGARFGSGWGWLVAGRNGALSIESTPNQDSPLMSGKQPVLGCDVWEHAYYLKYQNRRPDYVSAWWNVVNWTDIGRRYDRAKGA